MLSISDHLPVCFTRKFSSDGKCPVHKTIQYRNTKDFNDTTFLDDLSNQPWNTIDIFDNPNDSLNFFSDIFLSVLNTHAPLKHRRVKHSNQPGWLNEDIKKAMKIRDNAKTIGDTTQYRHWRNHVKHHILLAKKQFYTNTINISKNNGDTKSL